MTPHHHLVVRTLLRDISARCWRYRTGLSAAEARPVGLFSRDHQHHQHKHQHHPRLLSSSSTTTSMEEILARVVAPLPTYETRDKTPPPPESNSLDLIAFYQGLPPRNGDLRDHPDHPPRGDRGEQQTTTRLAFVEKLSRECGVDHWSVSELSVRLLETVQQRDDVATILQAEDR